MRLHKGIQVVIQIIFNGNFDTVCSWVAYLYKDKFMTERILHYPAAPTCGFFFLSHFGGCSRFSSLILLLSCRAMSFTIGVGAGKFLKVRRIFSQISPNLPEKKNSKKRNIFAQISPDFPEKY